MKSTKISSLIICMLICLVTLISSILLLSNASIASAVESYNADNFTYELTTNENGESSYKITVKPASRPTLRVAIIPETYEGLPVTEIADNGFFSCANLEKVILPTTIETIGNNAFMNCAKLAQLSLPKVKNIGNSAFGMCPNLEGLFIPYTVQTVGATILINNANTVYVQKSYEEISNAEWSSAWNDYHTGKIVYNAEPEDTLKYREILNENNELQGLEIIEYQSLFAPDSDIVIYNAIIPENQSIYYPVLNICSEAFTFSTVNSVTIKARNEEELNGQAFTHSINIRSNAFCAAIINEVIIETDVIFDHPTELKEVQSLFDSQPIEGDENGHSIRIFDFCYMHSITLPSNISFIPNKMFLNCPYLSSIKIAGEEYNNINIIPDVETIGESAFSSCIGLENLTIPNSVKEVGKNAFFAWGTGENKQYLNIDIYEDELPEGWINWTEGENDKFAIIFKALKELTLDLQDGTGKTVPIFVKPGKTMPAVEKPVRQGYSFRGIFSGKNGTGLQYYTDELIVARVWNIGESETLYVNWQQSSSKVILDNTYNIVELENVTYGQPMPAVEMPARSGYNFGGYYFIEDDGSHTYYYNSIMGSVRNWDKMETVILHADWIAIEYTITYTNLQGGINPSSNPKTYTVEDSEIVFEAPYGRKGYNGSWQPASIPAGSIGDRIVTAEWTPIIYKITYAGADKGNNPETYTIESDTIVFEDPKGLIGYEGKWNPETIPQGSIGDITISPIWKPVVYNITYVGADRGNNPETYTIESDDIVFEKPIGPDGYVWEWDPPYIPAGSTGNKTITAVGQIYRYRIEYDVDLKGLTNPNPEYYTVEDEVIFINLHKDGYTFEWQPASLPKNTTGDQTIKGVWTAIEYKIYYEGVTADTINPNPKTHTVEDYIVLQNGIRKGYNVTWTQKVIGYYAGDITVKAIYNEKPLDEVREYLTRPEVDVNGYYYSIYGPKQMNELRDRVNKGELYGGNVRLCSDIDLTENGTKDWEPFTRFGFDLYGYGYTITYKNDNVTGSENYGFIRDLEGHIEDVNFKAQIKTSTTYTGQFLGVVAAYAHGSSYVRYCNLLSYVEGYVYYTSSTNNNVDVLVKSSNTTTGGIVGISYGTVYHCESQISIASMGNIGGIVGYNDFALQYSINRGKIFYDMNETSNGSNRYIGGIAGCHNDNFAIYSCENYATITFACVSNNSPKAKSPYIGLIVGLEESRYGTSSLKDNIKGGLVVTNGISKDYLDNVHNEERGFYRDLRNKS